MISAQRTCTYCVPHSSHVHFVSVGKKKTCKHKTLMIHMLKYLGGIMAAAIYFEMYFKIRHINGWIEEWIDGQ